MGILNYIRSRMEDGDPEFDLDWEIAREMANDHAEARFAAKKPTLSASAGNANLSMTKRSTSTGESVASSESISQTGGAAQARFSRGGVGPSKLGDGKQRYYEVPFAKAVDKIVKAKKPVSDEHVFISETPGVFKEIGMPALPVVMNQQHVVSCYFGKDDGVKAGNMHGLGERLKLLPKTLNKPMMIIVNDSNPSSSVIAIVKMLDRDGHTVITPVEINGIGLSTEGRITANVVKTAFGKKNLWSEKVVKALRDEAEGKVGVFYVDSNEARQISNRLASEAFDFGGTERQLLSSAKGTLHSLSDYDSPVKGVGAQIESRQFKRWFGKSKVVNRAGQPQVVYHGTPK